MFSPKQCFEKNPMKMIGNHAILSRENTENTGKKNRFRTFLCYTYQQKTCHMQIGISIKKRRWCAHRRNKNKHMHRKKNILLCFLCSRSSLLFH